MTTTLATITPQALQERLKRGEAGELIDVRSGAEFEALHATPARLVPLDKLEPARFAGRPAAAGPIYLICQSGTRARMAAEKLVAAGVGDCVVVEGGTTAWAAAGLPVERGSSSVISIERQVRIIVGVGVLTGVLLAQFISPAFIWLAAFFGAGMLFAGLTDTCGMAIVLARMPWNQGSKLGGTHGASCSR